MFKIHGAGLALMREAAVGEHGDLCRCPGPNRLMVPRGCGWIVAVAGGATDLRACGSRGFSERQAGMLAVTPSPNLTGDWYYPSPSAGLWWSKLNDR